jgi:hypothetical protein
MLLRIAVVALAVLVGLIAWLTTRDSGEGGVQPEAGSRILSEGELGESAREASYPIYWVGAVPGTSLELSDLPEQGKRVRYLPEGTEPGGGSVEVLTVSSYPLADPAAALAVAAKRPGAIVRHAADGREVVSNEERPTSVYFTNSDDSVQVEVYDPSAKQAMSYALSGRVRPAG